MARAKKEANYFEMLARMAQCAKRASVQMSEMLEHYDHVAEKAGDVHKTEHECDDILHELVNELARAFITPIDREDLLQIASSLDTITDTIEEVADSFDVMGITVVRPEALAMASLISLGCTAILDAISEFPRFKHSKILPGMLVEVNRIEEEGDRLHRSIIKSLYQNDREPLMEVLKWKEIYDGMEHVLDACEDVADILEGLTVKNS